MSELENLILEQLHQNENWIPFDDFMRMALYTPGAGYYSSAMEKFGPTGDFVTAPTMGNIFGDCIAKHLAPILQHLPSGAVILEVGAGDGSLAATILNKLCEMDQLPEQYWILELSGDLKQRQRDTLLSQCPKLVDRVSWLTTLPADQFDGVILGNEVLDALPAKRFEAHQGNIFELGITYSDQDKSLQWQRNSETNAQWEAQLSRYGLADGYRSEIHPIYEPFITSLAEQLQQGYMLWIDYGYAASTYYHPERYEGTLMCYYQHKAHDNPFIHIGSQDISTHVNFSTLAETMVDNGMTIAGFSTQGEFLLHNGLLAREHHSALNANEILEIKKLIMPEHLGETFKVMGAYKSLNEEAAVSWAMKQLRIE